MIARFDSECDSCGTQIEEGYDEVFRGADGWICEVCHEEEIS